MIFQKKGVCFSFFFILLLIKISGFSFTISVFHPAHSEKTQILYENFLKAYQKKNPFLQFKYINIHNLSSDELFEKAKEASLTSDAFLGPYFSNQAAIVLKAVASKILPVLSLYASSTKLANQYPGFFSLTFSNYAQAQKISQAITKQNLSVISVVYSELDNYAANLVFWLKFFLIQKKGLKVHFINTQYQNPEKPFDFFKNLVQTPQGVVYIFTGPYYYDILKFYLEKNPSFKATFFFLDGFELYATKKDYSIFSHAFWVTFFNPTPLLPPWAITFLKQEKPYAYDLVFLYAGLEILRQAYEKKQKTKQGLISILTQNSFNVQGQSFCFDSFGFRNLPPLLYKILPNNQFQKE